MWHVVKINNRLKVLLMFRRSFSVVVVVFHLFIFVLFFYFFIFVQRPYENHQMRFTLAIYQIR